MEHPGSLQILSVYQNDVQWQMNICFDTVRYAYKANIYLSVTFESEWAGGYYFIYLL